MGFSLPFFLSGNKNNTNGMLSSNGAETNDEMMQRMHPSGTNEDAGEANSAFNNLVGKEAPDFSLESIEGKTIRLSDYKGKNVVLFFNEGKMCYPACWDQIAALGNDKRFDTNSLVAFSILGDQKSEWEKIIRQVPTLSKAKILFDTTKTVSSAYKVLSLPSSMHKGVYPGHTYFIIDKEGIIRYAFDDPNMAIRNEQLASEIEKIL